MARLRVLVISLTAPYPPVGGARSKLYHTLTEVSRHHEVDLLLAPMENLPEKDAAALSGLAKTVKLAPFEPRLGLAARARAFAGPLPFVFAALRRAPVREEIKKALAEKTYDLIHVEGCFLGMALLGLKTPPRLIGPHDAYWRNYQENLKIAPWRKKITLAVDLAKLRWAEPRLYGCFDAVGVCTEVEARAVRSLAPGLHVGVVGNGALLDESEKEPRLEDFPSVVFSGSYDYPPNEEAALRLLRELAPRLRRRWPELKLYIVGSSPTRRMEKAAAGHPANIVTGRVASVREWLTKGTVYLSPLSHGVGFKNKVPEAWAAGRPLVATPKTMEGIDFIPGTHALVAESDDGLARAAAWLLEDGERRRKIALAGAERVREQYNWPRQAEGLLALYDYVAARPMNRR